MPNYVRWREDAATYFFTVVTFRRQPILRDPQGRQILRESFVEVRRRWPFDMFACVLLPDHLHCIWTLPHGDDDFPIRWANVKRIFSKNWIAAGHAAMPVSANAHRHRQRGVWQARYWEHRIRDEGELFAYRDYIHLNPVKHGLVHHPVEWAWSSVHRHLRMGWLAPDWTAWTPIRVDDVGEPS